MKPETNPAFFVHTQFTLTYLIGILIVCTAFAAPVQKTDPSLHEPISLGEFKFRIAAVTFDETAMGFVPVDMDEDDKLMFVEFELLEGDRNSFKSLEMTVSCGSSRKSKPVILTSEGIMQMLSTVVRKKSRSVHEPERGNIAFVFVVPENEDRHHLNLPTGRTLDLAPFKKRSIFSDRRSL